MPEPLEIQKFERIIDCGEEVDFNTDLANNIVRIRQGLADEMYLKIGIKIGQEIGRRVHAAHFLGDVD